MATVKDILARTVEILETDGWCQGLYTDPSTGAHCLLSALNKAFSELPYGPCDALKARTETITAIRQLISTPSIMLWNDVSGRTKQEVLGLLERAQAILTKPSDAIPEV